MRWCLLEVWELGNERARVLACIHLCACMCVCLDWKRAHSCLIHLDSSLISKIFRDRFQQPQNSASLPHTTNTPHLFLSLSLSLCLIPLFLLAESPPIGRCTLRWQPKCQPALHMPASAVPAYSCHSPPGFSWPALPKSVPAPSTHPPPHSSVSTPSLSSPTHTPNLIPLVPVLPLVSHKAVKHFRQPVHIHLSYLSVCFTLPPLALFSPYTLHSSDLHLLFSALLSIPQLSSSFLRPPLT